MVERNEVHVELEEQRCLIEQQQFQLQRQQRHIQLLRQMTMAMQSELDALRAEVQPRARSTPRRHGNGHRHIPTSPRPDESISTRDQP